MSWRVIDFVLLFLFIFTATGIPFGDEPRQETHHLIPTQWGKDSEISYHWPKGEVPYVFDDKSYDNGVKTHIQLAMAALERDSCIRFREQPKRKSDGSWLHFTNPNALRKCSHEPSFKANGEIQVVMGYDCLRQRDILHSVLHGVGFRDEVSHPQRDQFVKIMWPNIQSAYKSMFRIQPVEHAGGLVEYDPMSIMHFHDRAYSLNGQATITPLLPGLKIAPSDHLSHLDKMKLRIMFGHECNKRKVGEVLNKCKGILSQYDPSELIPNKNKENNDLPKNGNAEDDPSGNKDESVNKNTNGEQEVVIVGNEKKNTGNSEDDNPKNDENLNIYTKVPKNEEVIIVGNGNNGADNQNENPIESEDGADLNNDNKYNENKVENEVIIVGNDKKRGSNEDLKGQIIYNDAIAQDID